MEKTRILIIALLLFIFFIIVSIIDGFFTVPVFEQGEGYGKLPYWLFAMGVLLSMVGIGMGVASLLGDPLGWSYEDYIAVILLTVQPWILILGGFLDMISYPTQNYVRGVPLVSGALASLEYRWTWLDNPFMFCYWISKGLGFEGTVTLGVILGSIFSVAIVVTLWMVYYEYA